MKTLFRIGSGLPCAAAAALLAGSACAAPSGDIAAGAQPRYHIQYLDSLGGSRSIARGIDSRGRVSGRSTLPGDEVERAVLWSGSAPRDLGTLGGPNSSVMWPAKNARGLIAGIAQTAAPDPEGEVWSCGYFFPKATATGHVCVGFVWERGRMRALPTLGGTHGFATAANDRGQIVGWAETAVRDPDCVDPQVFGFRAVQWGPRADQARELPPLPGHGASAATAINARGQVVGISGHCDQAFGRLSAIAAVIWEDGEPREIPTFGGGAWNTAMAINLRGEVVGFANAAGAGADEFRPRAFLWVSGGSTRDLGTLDAEGSAQASAVNNRRQVVGSACSAAGACRAFLWERGRMLDLNALSDPGAGTVLTAAHDIDDRGRIVGQASVGGGVTRAFLATPLRPR